MGDVVEEPVQNIGIEKGQLEKKDLGGWITQL